MNKSRVVLNKLSEIAGMVTKLAKESGKSEIEVERLWDESKKIALETKKESDPLYYGLVVNILKGKLGLEEK